MTKITAASEEGFQEAAEERLKRATQTLRGVTGFVMLAAVAGGSIGLGALYYTIVASDAGLSFATVRAVGGLVFSLGLAIVLVGGAELFTGNNLIVMAWASGKISTPAVLRRA
jgi:formate/nitrite transporter FocA (FNT family)